MTDSDTDTDSASPSWDDLSFQRPAAPAVDGTVAPGTDPAVAAAINRMNQGLSAGQSDDEILSNEVGDIGRTGRKVTATTTGDTTDDDKKSKKSDGAPSWDSLSFSKPTPPTGDSDLDDPINTPNYAQQVWNSPVSRDAPPDQGDVPSAVPALTQKARAADAAAAGPTDNRRDVGAGEGAERAFSEGASKVVGLGVGALNALGYPITAADAALSGRDIPSMTDVVADSEKPYQQEAQSYAINPNKEKLTLAGQVGAGVGSGAEQLLSMVVAPETKLAESGVGLAEQLATKLSQTAAVSSAPAASAAKDAAQGAIDDGKTPLEAAQAAMSAYESTVQTNLLPVSAEGKIVTRAGTGGAIGAAQAAIGGGSAQDIASGAIVGAGMGASMGHEGAAPESRADRAQRRTQEATDQLLQNTETSNANEIPQDQGGVSEAGTQPQSGGESRGEDLQQPAKAESGASDAQQQVTRDDLVNRWQNAEGATAQRKAADDLAAYDATNKGDADVDQNVQPPSASGDAEKGASDVGTSAKDESAPNAGETKPFTPEERSKEKTEAILDKVPDLSDEQKGYLRDNMPAPEKDSVTGYYTRPELKPTIDAAKDSGEPSAYAEVDLRNLGGLNAHVGSNSGADEHYTAMADIIRQEAEKSGAQVVPIRKGGDEMGLVFKGADANTAHQTMLNAQDRIADYATTNGLSDIANPKGGAKGTGIHFGVSDILPEHSTSDIIKRADTLVELRKKGETYEYPRPTEEVGTGERAAGRPGASTEASGVRDAGTDGLADDHEQATQGQRSGAAESGADDERAGESQSVAEPALYSRNNPTEDERNASYANAPDSLMGFRRQGPQKAYEDSNYKHFQPVHVKDNGAFPFDMVDGMSGLNKAHALERARRNWPDAEVSEATPEEYIAEHGSLPETGVNKYRTGTASEGVTAPEARDTLKKEFGSTAVRKMEAAGLKISPSSDLPKLSPELSPAERAGVKGVTAGGRPHLIHDQTSAAEIPGTVVHEIWHANADRVLPKTKQEALARAVDKVPGVQSALAKIPGSTNPAHVNAEKVAYALQHLRDNSVGTRALDAIKIGLNRLGVPKNWLDANESLLRRIGSENLKHFQETPRTYQDTGTERAAKPRIRVPVDQVPVSRTEDRATPTGAPTQRVTSIKNAQVNAEREERNAPLLESVKGASNKEAMDKAGEQLTKDPDLGRRLTAELLKSPRPLNKTEVAVMLRDRVRIHNELEDSYDEAHANPGDSGTIARIKDLEMQRDANDQADRLAGTENSLGLSARSMMANQDYSLVNMVKRLQVASGKSELPPETMKKVRAISDGLKALTPKRADNSPKAIKDEFESLKNELAGISAKPSSKPAGALYARAEPKVAEIIQRMAANRAAAGVPEDVAMNEIHAAVSPHADVSIKDVRDAVNDPKNANRQKFQDRKEAELGRRIQQGDFTKAQRYKPVYNEATLEREGKINALQKRFDALKRTEEQKNQSTAMKVGSTIHNAHIASILASLRVYPKLAGAVVAKYIGHGLEQATGALVQHLPGIRGIAAKADTQRVSLGGEAQYLKGIGKSFGEAKNTLMRGYSDLDAKYGGKDTITDEYTDYADKLFGGMGDAIKDGRYLDAARAATSGVARFEGRTHGAIKSFASTPKFYESYYNAAQKMMGDLRKSGMKEPEIEEYMSRRSTDLTLGTKAYLNSLEDKMQGKNALADGINRMMVSWDNSGNKGLQGLSLAFQTVFPIRKIPINIAKEVSSYAFGGIKALAASHGDMTGERADYIMKNIKKQGAGAALFALGYLAGPTMLGGVPQSGDAKKHLPVKPGEASIGGTEIGDSAFHSAVGQILQLGAGYRRAYGSYYGQSHNAVTAGLEALGDQYSSQLIRQVPYLDQPRRWMQTAEYAPRDKRSAVSEIVGNQLRSMVVPGVVQQAAQAQDSYKGWRKPKNILQDIETGIPGLRETVPTR